MQTGKRQRSEDSDSKFIHIDDALYANISYFLGEVYIHIRMFKSAKQATNKGVHFTPKIWPELPYLMSCAGVSSDNAITVKKSRTGITIRRNDKERTITLTTQTMAKLQLHFGEITGHVERIMKAKGMEYDVLEVFGNHMAEISNVMASLGTRIMRKERTRNCYGCSVDSPSQKDHPCLEEQDKTVRDLAYTEAMMKISLKMVCAIYTMAGKCVPGIYFDAIEKRNRTEIMDRITTGTLDDNAEKMVQSFIDSMCFI